jgi:2-amino-4-hydroxy-6-hydroxymethyldihydropteridine diphosphokinase
VRAVLAFGANLPGDLGDPAAQIAHAAASLASTAGIRVLASSRMFATPPWGVADQAEFRNCVLIADVEDALFTPLDLLHRCQAEEQAAHRVRARALGTAHTGRRPGRAVLGHGGGDPQRRPVG